MLYRVRIGEDEYIGSADEVVAFMARAEGAPGTDVATYMEGVAERLRATLEVEGISTSDPVSFLESLDEHGVVPIEVFSEPARGRVSPEDALGEDPVSLGEGVDPDDLKL